MADGSTLGDLLAAVGEEVREPVRTLTSSLAELSRSPEAVLLRHALKSARTIGGEARLLTRQDVGETLGRLKDLADRLRREGIDPALGMANLIGDCLDGLEVLAATGTVPVPIELEQLRLALARLRRPEVRLDLVLPAQRARARLAGRLIRDLVEDAEDLAEGQSALSELEAAVAEAVAGAVERTQAHDPSQPVEVHARLRGDLLAVDVIDRGADEPPAEQAGAAGARRSEPRWDLGLVRRVMDQVAYEPGERGGALHLRKRLRSWQLRGPGW